MDEYIDIFQIENILSKFYFDFPPSSKFFLRQSEFRRFFDEYLFHLLLFIQFQYLNYFSAVS